MSDTSEENFTNGSGVHDHQVMCVTSEVILKSCFGQ